MPACKHVLLSCWTWNELLNLIGWKQYDAKWKITYLRYFDLLIFQEHWKYDPFDAHKDEDGNIYARGSQVWVLEVGKKTSLDCTYLCAGRVDTDYNGSPNVHECSWIWIFYFKCSWKRNFYISPISDWYFSTNLLLLIYSDYFTINLNVNKKCECHRQIRRPEMLLSSAVPLQMFLNFTLNYVHTLCV